MLMLMPPRIHPQVVMSNAIRNLSSNFLEGTLPSGLGQESLARLDLSNNQLTGSIPESLASSNLQLVDLHHGVCFYILYQQDFHQELNHCIN
ncbi:hypothetical protein CK203_091530 [Vitis vinifera]|uniref:Uncharacterized protein n=1 Tax=Vitis vinifera TaxID=29760 RepID=A0A438ED64_VITVI|nr:hypothetical protein CK203_091530 [Vitis vinifera]